MCTCIFENAHIAVLNVSILCHGMCVHFKHRKVQAYLCTYILYVCAFYVHILMCLCMLSRLFKNSGLVLGCMLTPMALTSLVVCTSLRAPRLEGELNPAFTVQSTVKSVLRTTCTQGPSVHKDHLYTRTTCTQGPPVHKDHLYTRTTCTQ